MKFDIKKFMTINVGQKDRVIRVIVAIFLLIGVYNGGFINHWIIALIALALLASAYFRFCPVYRLVDKNTNQEQPPAGS